MSATRASSLPSSYHIESLARGLSVLSEFSEERPALSLTDISQRLQLNKTTTFRLLCTLESLGYLERDVQTKRYQPALEVLRLGFVVLNNLDAPARTRTKTTAAVTRLLRMAAAVRFIRAP